MSSSSSSLSSSSTTTSDKPKNTLINNNSFSSFPKLTRPKLKVKKKSNSPFSSNSSSSFAIYSNKILKNESKKSKGKDPVMTKGEISAVKATENNNLSPNRVAVDYTPSENSKYIQERIEGSFMETGLNQLEIVTPKGMTQDHQNRLNYTSSYFSSSASIDPPSYHFSNDDWSNVVSNCQKNHSQKRIHSIKTSKNQTMEDPMQGKSFRNLLFLAVTVFGLIGFSWHVGMNIYDTKQHNLKTVPTSSLTSNQNDNTYDTIETNSILKSTSTILAVTSPPIQREDGNDKKQQLDAINIRGSKVLKEQNQHIENIEKAEALTGTTTLASAYYSKMEESENENEQTKNEEEVKEIVNMAKSSSSTTAASAAEISDTISDSQKIRFTVTNAYGQHEYKDSLYPWLNGKKLIEPHTTTTLEIAAESQKEDYIYRWIIDQRDVYYGTRLEEFTFADVGEHTVRIEELDSTKTILNNFIEEKILVRYVRREIRNLTPEDRNLFLDTAKVMWDISQEVGTLLYGSKFKSILVLNEFHLNMAGDPLCDHIHEGMGFLTQHTAFSLSFEQSLQAINPKVTLPYWDYTIDIENIGRNFDDQFSDNWFKQTLFNEEYFGAVNEETHSVENGRWKNTEISKIADSYENTTTVHNAFGYLRAPWNQNNSPYLTRASTVCGANMVTDYWTMPSCTVHYNILSYYNSYYDFMFELPYTPHGPIHALIGGVIGDCVDRYEKVREIDETFDDDSFIQYLKNIAFISNKNLFRKKWMECPVYCEDGEICACSCPHLQDAYDADTLDDYLEITFVAWNEPSTANSRKVYSASKDIQMKILDAVCTSNVVAGDQLEAGSPMDISFWPIHPTTERLFHYKKLKGLLLDESWDDESVSTSSFFCYGHYADNEILLRYLYDDSEYITNADMYNHLNPFDATAASYIYDEFEWNHCKELGIDFSLISYRKSIGDDDLNSA